MITFIRKNVFGNSSKNISAPYIFLILLAHGIIVPVYTFLTGYGWQGMLIRLGLSVVNLAVFALCERSRLSATATAFLSPTIIFVLLIGAALYFGGDSLLFIYMCCVAQISMTYFNKKGLMAHIVTVTLISAVTITIRRFAFSDGINLLGKTEHFSLSYHYISLVGAFALCLITYTFCSFCIKTLNALTEAKNEAMVAAKAKSSFLAKMSHEIRTPLNAVIGLTDNELRKESLVNHDVLKKINTSGSLLLGIINDILDLSKIESGKFDLAPSEYIFADLIYDTATLNIGRAGGRPIKFKLDINGNIPRRLIGDNLRLKQLLNNLLSNAFKYTREGTVTLRASWAPEGDGAKIIFEVADTGIGIKEEDLKKLFAEYSQVDLKNNRGTEGTGLGLSICKGLAENMGGKVYAKSEYGKGSVFIAEIYQGIADNTPIGKRAADSLAAFTYRPEDKTDGVEYVSLPDARVLVVDDMEINLEVASYCLEPYEMHVDCVTSGFTAVDYIKKGKIYNIIFMDHMMPGMDGIETAKAIRALKVKGADTVPIVALTANAVTGSDKMFAENGFQDFLSKPIEPDKLDAVIKKWIKRD